LINRTFHVKRFLIVDIKITLHYCGWLWLAGLWCLTPLSFISVISFYWSKKPENRLAATHWQTYFIT